MKKLVFIAFLFIFTCNVYAQTDSLGHYNLMQLDSIYQKNYNQGKLNKLLPYSLAMLKKVNVGLDKNDTAFAKILFKVGYSYANTNKMDSALAYYNNAVSIQKIKIPKHQDYAKSLSSIGAIYLQLSNYAEAELYFLQALAIIKEALGEKNIEYAKCLNNLGVLYYYLGNYDKTETFWVQALAINKELFGEKHPESARIINNLGSMYNAIGDIAKAEIFWSQSLAITKETLGEKHPNYAAALVNIGILYSRLKDYTKAEAFHLDALAIYKEIVGEKDINYITCLTKLGILYFNMGEYAKAEPVYLKTLTEYKEIFGEKHHNYIGNLNSLGVLYEHMKQYNKAQPYYGKTLPGRVDYLEYVGNALGEKDRQHFYKEMFPTINNANFFAVLYSQHDSLFALVQDGLLFTKSYSLSGASDLLPLIKMLKDTSLNTAYANWINTKQQIGKAYEMTQNDRIKKGINLDSLISLSNNQENELIRKSTVLKERLGYNEKRFHYKDLKANIDKNEVVIDFARVVVPHADTVLYCAIINKQEWEFPKSVVLCAEKELLPYVNAEINPASPSYITQPQQSKALYKLLIQPLEPYLKKAKTIHWATVGVLHELAMATLKDDKNKMLSEKIKIHQYSSLKDFIIKKTNEGSTGSINKNVLLVGDIAFDLEETEHINLTDNNKINENLYVSRSAAIDSSRNSTAARFTRLEGTKKEVEILKNAFTIKKWSIEQLQEKHALEERIREFSGNNTPRVLHFATHGFFLPAKDTEEDNPLLRSGIALAGANRVWLGKNRIDGVEDGLWTAYEIANLDLSPADLVVLSACETAKGQVDPHEGVVGLQRSFKIAGVDNMLLSLWQVPDKETVELMEEFYKYYLNGESPAASLHKAQQTMRKRYPDPYYWAAFVLIE